MHPTQKNAIRCRTPMASLQGPGPLRINIICHVKFHFLYCTCNCYFDGSQDCNLRNSSVTAKKSNFKPLVFTVVYNQAFEKLKSLILPKMK